MTRKAETPQTFILLYLINFATVGSAFVAAAISGLAIASVIIALLMVMIAVIFTAQRDFHQEDKKPPSTSDSSLHQPRTAHQQNPHKAARPIVELVNLNLKHNCAFHHC